MVTYTRWAPHKGGHVQALAETSAVGFGTRRWTGSPTEVHTLDLALDRGCSLVDVTVVPGLIDEVERAVGRVLARRLEDVTVVTLCGSLEPSAVAERVRVAASRLRRDRLDVLLFDEPERLIGASAVDAPAAQERVRAAFAACESLVDRGELGWYGVNSARLAPTASVHAPLGLDRLLSIAQNLRRDHRFGVLQVPCEVLTGRTSDGQRGGLVRQARIGGLATIGTGPMPVWPSSGAAPLAACQTFLMDGVDHVLVDPSCEAQVRAVAPMLAGRIPAPRRAGLAPLEPVALCGARP